MDKTDLLIAKTKESLTAVLGTSHFDLFNKTTRSSYCEKLDVGQYELLVGEIGDVKGAKTKVAASFELHPMINCCGICVSTKAFVAEGFRRKGLGAMLNSLRIEIARLNGYGLLLCTDVESNEAQRKVLAKNGWKDVHDFVNPRTQNKVFISVVNL